MFHLLKLFSVKNFLVLTIKLCYLIENNETYENK